MGEKDDKHSNSSDGALFRDAVSDIQPLRARGRHSGQQAPKPARRRTEDQAQKQRTRELPMADSRPGDAFGEEMIYNEPSVNRKTMRELRRGKLAPRDELDLHGLTQAQAESELREFLAHSIARNYRCVRIVHGKGLRSGTAGPALKALVNRHLQSDTAVRAFTSAPAAAGGTGAVLVLLRTR